MEPSATPQPLAGTYRIAGEGSAPVSRIELRDRIRDGLLSPETEIAADSSDEYRAALSYPELARYFSLIAQVPAGGAPASAAGLVHAGGWIAPPDSNRLLAGLAYPFSGMAWILIVAAALLQLVPLGAIAASILTSVYTLAIIRASSDGRTDAPPLAETGAPVLFLTRLVKVIVVTLVSAWPVFVAIPLVLILRSSIVVLVAAAVMVLYYPAAVATLAKWDSITFAVTPSQIFRFIGILSPEYFIALGAYVACLVIATLGATALLPKAGAIAMVGSSLLFTWATFYFFHLVGWGMYRHADELQ